MPANSNDGTETSLRNIVTLLSGGSGEIVSSPNDSTEESLRKVVTLLGNGSGANTGLLAGVQWTDRHTTSTGNPYLFGSIVYNAGRVYRCIAENDSIPPQLGGNDYWADLGVGYLLPNENPKIEGGSINTSTFNKPDETSGVLYSRTVPADGVTFGFYLARSGSFNLKPTYDYNEGEYLLRYAGGSWFIELEGQPIATAVAGDEPYPWLATWPSLTSITREPTQAGGSINASGGAGGGGGSINTSNGGGSINLANGGGNIISNGSTIDGDLVSGGTLNMSAGANGAGGSIDTSNGGGYINTSGDASGNAGGYINTSATNGLAGGGYINTTGGDGAGGFIDTRGDNYGNSGGFINTSGSDNAGAGGSINTSNGGGSINTTGIDGNVGGSINTSATGEGNGGSINTSNSGGSINTSGGDAGSGGSINTSAGDSDGGGSINTSGGEGGVGGSINTSNGGGSINISNHGGSIVSTGGGDSTGGSINLSASASANNSSSTGGSISLLGADNDRAGNITSNAGNQDNNSRGGDLNMSGDSKRGGDINTASGTHSPADNGPAIFYGGRGGDIITSGGSASGVSEGKDGGSINTSNGGGSINTRGVGSIQLGNEGTRTTLVGSASATDKTITLPNATGTVALTSDVRFGAKTVFTLGGEEKITYALGTSYVYGAHVTRPSKVSGGFDQTGLYIQGNWTITGLVIMAIYPSTGTAGVTYGLVKLNSASSATSLWTAPSSSPLSNGLHTINNTLNVSLSDGDRIGFQLTIGNSTGATVPTNANTTTILANIYCVPR